MSATKKTPAKRKGSTALVKKDGLPIAERPPAKVVIQGNTLSKLVLRGDLSGLSEQETMEYYLRFCEHLGLDPVTRPFDILVLKGKKVLYAHKGCTDQLRMKYGVSVTDLRGEVLADCYRVTAIGRDHKGRTDAATGVVKVQGLKGDEYANAVMKAETKAKRRLTLSLCGLGMLDESEIETIPGAIAVSLNGEAVYDVGGSGKERDKEYTDMTDSEHMSSTGERQDSKLAALADLRDVFSKMKKCGLFTDAELAEKAALVTSKKDDLQSLIDLQTAWVDEINSRKRGEEK